MSFQDILKKSFLESFTNTFTANFIIAMAIALAVSLLFGLLICFIYHRFYRGVVYNRSFSITLVGMTIMTTMVTLAISSNIVISLGMVGALSIVRYRTAVKEPLDLLYLFWAITTGITVGAQMYPLSVLGAVFMVLVLICFNRRKNGGHVYIVVLRYLSEEPTAEIRRALNGTKYRIKSKTQRGDGTELAMEVYASNKSLSFSDKLRGIEGVDEVTTIQYDGEYHA